MIRAANRVQMLLIGCQPCSRAHAALRVPNEECIYQELGFGNVHCYPKLPPATQRAPYKGFLHTHADTISLLGQQHCTAPARHRSAQNA
mmetsp:Transcript_136522/g.251069  ORF Transcript_136522/g.251069 Transcript_136522/m.251069 type:complete len:89 (+) Transcript_136522:271-537(+)